MVQLYIPAAVTSVDGAFHDFRGTIMYEGPEMWCKTKNTSSFNSSIDIYLNIKSLRINQEYTYCITLEDEVIIVRYNHNLTVIEIPRTIDDLPVVEIGYHAFASHHLTSVIIPDTVTTIDERAFSNNSLTTVMIPASVILMASNAFASNPSISLIYL
jgi:hypothetical protein